MDRSNFCLRTKVFTNLHTVSNRVTTMKKLALLIPVAASALLMMGCHQYLCLAPAGTTANSKLTICHKTGKAGKFELLTIKASAADAHIKHGDFLAPAGAKKAKDCVEPTTPPTDTVVVVPPIVIDTVVVPPVVVPPVVTPPVVTPPVVIDTVVVVPPVVVPPVVVDPTPGPGTSGGGTGEEEEETPPSVDPLFCILNPTHADCGI
jgi:hypothetical protein